MLEAGCWLCKLNRIALVQVDIGLAACGSEASSSLGAHRLRLTWEVHNADFTRFNLVNFLDSARDGGLRRALGNSERVDSFLGHDECLFREPRRADDLVRHTLLVRRGVRAMLADNFFFLNFFLCSENSHMSLFSACNERFECRLRLLNDEIFVCHYVNRIEVTQLLRLHTPEITETFYRIRVIRVERKECCILFLRDEFCCA